MSLDCSIIIVNYNVAAFLEQCLYSVFQATKNISAEVFVVDNNSVDDSVEMVQQNFPQVKLICNHENKGFAFACNQALRISAGNYALLLNPDTIIREDSLVKCRDFMDKNLGAGALGVKMINGQGVFLPESKRSVPTASSSFYKIFGFSTLFPKSKRFGKYQLKYLDPDQIHEVEVLSGAFMFIRKSVLDHTGLLDEAFFMYGEDIDLSYRILKAGYKNYYFPETSIIHFKGESTKKASFSYIKHFYKAMLIFSAKHAKGNTINLLTVLIHTAIYLRAVLSVVSRFFRLFLLPLCDFFLSYAIYSWALPVWENYKFLGNKAYSDTNLSTYIVVYLFIWVIFTAYYKGFQPFARIKELAKAVIWGTVFILAGYSLLPESYRISRAIILIGAGIYFFSTTLNRILFRLILNWGKSIAKNQKKGALIIGNYSNTMLIDHPAYLHESYEIKKILKLNENDLSNTFWYDKIHEIVKIYKIDTIIFFIKDLPVSNLINSIVYMARQNLEFKMVLPLSLSMVGTQSVINLNELPDFKLNPISKPENLIKKRLVDILVTFAFILLTPFFLIRNNPKNYFPLLVKVAINKLSWVSYSNYFHIDKSGLPPLKPGVFSPKIPGENSGSQNNEFETNLNYAKNYRVMTDFVSIFSALKKNRFKFVNKA
jgi:O-antigen biosynthesis protein